MKQTTKYVCRDCGYESMKWLGKCPSCGQWNTFDETQIVPLSKYDTKQHTAQASDNTPKKLDEIGEQDEERIVTGTDELDRVLGGGIVRGSMVLVGGNPGIGKSTLLLQICRSLSEFNILYVTGEESAAQVKMRANRLGVTAEKLRLLPETNLDTVIFHAGNIKPDIMIVDSIQTMYRNEVASAPGSVSQVREATHFLMRLAKENNIAIFIVGHVTKDGNIAGPRVLEHMVDCVLYFEGDNQQSYRILRTAKNRFGSTNEIGVFEMNDTGLVEVKNPSAMLLSGRPKNATGSAVVCTMEGSRPMLAEIQALSSQTSFSVARRMSTGIDSNRAAMLVAILEKRLGYTLQNQDVYINVVGGLKIAETASDLAVICAIASNYRNFVTDDKTLVLGEVGLTGELRSISFAQRRISEAKKMGFNKCIVPKANAESVQSIKGMTIYPAETVKDAVNILINNSNK